VALSLTLLGGFQARLSTGLVLNLRSRKAQALLAYLGLRPGQAHPRDKLAALLWGESRPDQARDALRHALAALRQVLPVTDPPILLAEGQTLGLSPTCVDVDVAAFEQYVAQGCGVWLLGVPEAAASEYGRLCRDDGGSPARRSPPDGVHVAYGPTTDAQSKTGCTMYGNRPPLRARCQGRPLSSKSRP
jgi:hypothetical protein